MADSILTLTTEGFDDATQNGTVLVDFWAPWCGPCRMMAPELEKVKAHYGDGLGVGKLNIDENEDTAMRYSVSSIPTMILFKNGKEISRFVGAQPAPRLIQSLDAAIEKAKSAV